jgi:hypothetical protein
VKPFFLLTLALQLCMSGILHAQWIVYDLSIKTLDNHSTNFDTYAGAYLIAPVEGGKATLIYLTEKEGRYYTVQPDTARYFMAANLHQRRAGISTAVQNGTSQTMLQLTGDMNVEVDYRVGTEKRKAQVAGALTGILMSSDDESQLTDLPADGSFGVIGMSQITAQYRADLSRLINEKPSTPQVAVNQILALLQRYGYRPEEELLLLEQYQVNRSNTLPSTASPIIHEPTEPLEIAPASSNGSLFPTTETAATSAP